MIRSQSTLKCLLVLSAIFCAAGFASAQDDEASTEITGYYQQYRDFSYGTGEPSIDIPDSKLTGGGFSAAHNLAPWFAIWTQVSFYGRVQSPAFSVRLINNLQGVRYQTRMYGPVRFYGKAGLGFSNLNFIISNTEGGENKLSAGYGGGAQVWFHRNFGVTLDLSHITMGLTQLTNLTNREKWDSGLVYTTGLSVRF